MAHTTQHYDVFRPRTAPASILYDAFQAEALHRKNRELDEWIKLELQAVFAAAAQYAQEHGLTAPTFEDVEAAERMARGSADYGSKWAIMVAQKMKVCRVDTAGQRTP
ncbi:hypothetical protein [Acidovorax sp. LjRoot194]|uniref:hypothetical protein n=1 Tax=Acidovorax sp. LjRoot194 TaxID=3342280 RepID=UPI003F4F411A